MADRRWGRQPSSSEDWRRANIAIAVGWAALAVIFGAYAIVRESLGALLLTLFVVWCMRLAWLSAWRGEEDD